MQTKGVKGRKGGGELNSFIEEDGYWVERLSRHGYFSAPETTMRVERRAKADSDLQPEAETTAKKKAERKSVSETGADQDCVVVRDSILLSV